MARPAKKDAQWNWLKKLYGYYDYLAKPELLNSWGQGPFNGQRYRQRIFFDLLYHCGIQSIVETGTFRGTTTALFAATSLPVYTTEIHPRFFSYATARFLFRHPNVHLYNKDSRQFLRHLAESGDLSKRNCFFYLDAHWRADLPLREELEIIFKHWPYAVVMIDDFKVPDTEYGFDAYPSGKILHLEYIRESVRSLELAVFFPIAAASEETGGRRGCAVLSRTCHSEHLKQQMGHLLRPCLL